MVNRLNFDFIQNVYEDAIRKQIENEAKLLAYLDKQEYERSWFDWERERLSDIYDMEYLYWQDQYQYHLNRSFGVIKKLLELHSPKNYKYPVCMGCPPGEIDRPDWPCVNVRLICKGDPDFDIHITRPKRPRRKKGKGSVVIPVVR